MMVVVTILLSQFVIDATNFLRSPISLGINIFKATYDRISRLRPGSRALIMLIMHKNKSGEVFLINVFVIICLCESDRDTVGTVSLETRFATKTHLQDAQKTREIGKISAEFKGDRSR